MNPQDVIVEIEPTERVVPVLEPVPLPSRAELASQVRATSTFRLLGKLVTCTEGGRVRVTSRGELTLAAARKAVTRLGLPGDQGPGCEPARTAADFDELHELWTWAVAGELVDPFDSRARPGRRGGVLYHGSDGDVLDVWTALVEFELGQWAAAFALQLDVVAAAAACCRTAEACSVSDLTDAATRSVDDGWPMEASSEPPEEVLAEMLTSLGRLGLVTVSGEEVRCTPVGLWALRGWLETVGVAAPEPKTVGARG